MSWDRAAWPLAITLHCENLQHYGDLIMSSMVSQINSPDWLFAQLFIRAQIKRNIKVPRHFVRGIHQSPVKSPHKGPVTRKLFPFDDVIMGVQSIHPLQLLSFDLHFQLQTNWLNSLLHSVLIWRHGTGSTLAQVMACCLTVPGHLLN